MCIYIMTINDYVNDLQTNKTKSCIRKCSIICSLQ